MTAPSITEFLLARIAEDEAVATAAIGLAGFSKQTGRWVAEDVQDTYGPISLVFAVAESGAKTQVADFTSAWERNERRAHIANNDPARVLAECAAKRAIVDLHFECRWASVPSGCSVCRTLSSIPDTYPCRTVSHLAAVYDSHPDYRQEWAL